MTFEGAALPHRWSDRRLGQSGRVLVWALVVVWGLGVANLTLFVTAGAGPRNAVPFHTIVDYLTDGNLPLQIRFRNLAGNLAMLAPLGLALAAATRWRLARVVLTIAMVSVAIELWQLLVATGRSVDVDDVILNLAGGVGAWVVGLGLLGLLGAWVPMALDRRGHEEDGAVTDHVASASAPAQERSSLH